jgi:hypothetical protein
MERGSTPPDAKPDDRIPRGAIIVVVVGILATIAAALLTTGEGEGEFAHLEFVQQAKVPDSKAVAVPGSSVAKMQLVDGTIQATATNVAGYSLFRVQNTLKIDAGAPVDEGQLVCSTHAPRRGTLIAQTHGELRATYPRSSEEGIYGQSVEETVLIKFSSHGYEYTVLEVGEDLPEKWTTVQGVKLEWPEYEEGTEHLDYMLPEAKQTSPIELPFYTVWKSTKPAAATVACRLQVGAGKATVETKGSLKKISPLIDEEAEEVKQEEREENEEAAGEGEESESEGE